MAQIATDTLLLICYVLQQVKAALPSYSCPNPCVYSTDIVNLETNVG